MLVLFDCHFCKANRSSQSPLDETGIILVLIEAQHKKNKSKVPFIFKSITENVRKCNSEALRPHDHENENEHPEKMDTFTSVFVTFI